MDKTKLALGVALVAMVIAIGSVFLLLNHSPKAGGVTNYDEVDATAMKIGGTNGSRLGPITATTCTLLANYSIAATSTRQTDCAVTGVVSGDTVFVTMPATTTIAGQYVVQSSFASSTSGFITIDLLNLTGIAATPAATVGFGSSTVVYFMHPVTSVPGL